MRLETLLVHLTDPDPATGGLAPPIHLSTTFERDTGGGPIAGFTYTRESNPTQELLEKGLAAAEGGEAALVFSSGMAAGLSLLEALPGGARVVMGDDAYYGFPASARELLPKRGIETAFVDMGDLDALRDALRPGAALLWLESPSNPLLKVTDIAAAAALGHAAGALVLVDSTFATPVVTRPLELGADVVLHSSTKYFGGHSDVQGGALVFKTKGETVERTHRCRSLLGCVASPFSSWLVLRGLKSLACRVNVQSAGAMAIATALDAHPAVSRVNYPGLPSHPGHEVARRQMSSFGGMLSFHVKAGLEAALAAVGRTKIFVRATSLGSVESLIEHRASSEGVGSKTAPDLVRLSVGLEHPDDLLADLMQALS